MPSSEIEKWIASLTEPELEHLLYDWEFWARPAQLPPATLPNGKPWRVWLIKSGRGFGKTRTGAEWTRSKAKSGTVEHIAIVGSTDDDVEQVMVNGECGILACSPPWFYPKWEKSNHRLVWPNGCIGTLFSGETPDKLRGPNNGAAWCDELAKWKYPDLAWDNLEFTLRLSEHPQVCATTTPRAIPIIKKLVASPRTFVTNGNTKDNFANLSDDFIEDIYAKYAGTRLGRQELDGEILDDNPNALWRRNDIEKARLFKRPTEDGFLSRIVIAVDPQAADPTEAASEQTADTGIVVVGRDKTTLQDAHFYVLADRTLRASPNTWGTAAVNAFLEFEADCIVAEQNNGGAMVKFVIETVARDMGVHVAVKLVTASRGKQTRAEPSAALYEQGRVHHIGGFPVLEDQMCTWQPGEKSPDNMDALVWGLTELAAKKGRFELL